MCKKYVQYAFYANYGTNESMTNMQNMHRDSADAGEGLGEPASETRKDSEKWLSYPASHWHGASDWHWPWPLSQDGLVSWWRWRPKLGKPPPPPALRLTGSRQLPGRSRRSRRTSVLMTCQWQWNSDSSSKAFTWDSLSPATVPCYDERDGAFALGGFVREVRLFVFVDRLPWLQVAAMIPHEPVTRITMCYIACKTAK